MTNEMHLLKYLACFQVVGIQLFLLNDSHLFSINQAIARRGKNRVEKKMEHSKQSISVMFCGSADTMFFSI